MSGNYPQGMTERDWAHVNGEDEQEEIDPSEDDTSPHRGNYND